MGDRRAEQRKDSVASRLHDVTAVAPHRLDHQLQCRIDNRARFLGVEVLHQLGRALDVGEQRRHRLALALDILGGGCVGYLNLRIVGSFWRATSRGCSQRSAAIFAESRSRIYPCLAGWTHQLQLPTALLAEPGVSSIVRSARWAQHLFTQPARRAAPWRP